MIRKTCDNCKMHSYGSNESKKWICPYCQNDISHVKAEGATNVVLFNRTTLFDKRKK